MIKMREISLGLAKIPEPCNRTVTSAVSGLLIEDRFMHRFNAFSSITSWYVKRDRTEVTAMNTQSQFREPRQAARVFATPPTSSKK